MREKSDELEELSSGKKLACNLSAAGIVLLAGLFLLLCGVGAINVSVSAALCGTLLLAVGLTLTVSAVIQLNTVSLWLGVCFLVPALVELLTKCTSAGYSRLYPMYIAIPAIASLFTVMLSREWKTHLPIILLFGVTAGIFALNSSGAAPWSVVIPIMVIYAGAVMLVWALRKRRTDKDEF